jgi:hypothetical protein
LLSVRTVAPLLCGALLPLPSRGKRALCAAQPESGVVRFGVTGGFFAIGGGFCGCFFVTGGSFFCIFGTLLLG